MPDKNREPRTDLYKVTFSKLALHPNLRQDLGEIGDLSKSIQLNGVISPLRGYRSNGIYFVVDGSRRYAAMEIIFNTTGDDTPCEFKLEPRGTSDDQRLLDQFTANDGKQLTPLEQAYGVQKFIEFGWDEKKIAESLCKSITYIKRLHSLINAPQEFIDLVKKHDISATFAMNMVSEGKAKVEDFLKTHKDGGFAKYEQQELIEDPDYKKPEAKQAKITKKDVLEAGEVKQANSWNEFKKYCEKADYTEMYEAKIYSPVDVFKFMLELKNNNMSWDGIRDFFMSTKEPKERKVKDEFVENTIPAKKNKPLKEGEEEIVREYPK